jgi:hypothetical protein
MGARGGESSRVPRVRFAGVVCGCVRASPSASSPASDLAGGWRESEKARDAASAIRDASSPSHGRSCHSIGYALAALPLENSMAHGSPAHPSQHVVAAGEIKEEVVEVVIESVRSCWI